MKVKSKLMTVAACAAAMILSHAVMAGTSGQETPAAGSSAAAPASAPGDRPASVDEDKPKPAPRLPSTLKNAGDTTGSVVVMVQVDASGKAKSFHVMMSSGSKQLDDEAIRTAKSWSYKPAIKDGAPAEGYVQIPITFR